MKENRTLLQEHFDALLSLFSENREEAGKAYESLRGRLVQFFLKKNCAQAEQLADETLNRLALKAETFDRGRNLDVAAFAFGFAAKVHLAYLRGPDKASSPLEREGPHVTDAPQMTPADEAEFDCLDACLQELSAEDRDLIIKYYSKEGAEKIELRRQLAEFMDIKPEALHMRVFRIKSRLRECVRSCMEKK